MFVANWLSLLPVFVGLSWIFFFVGLLVSITGVFLLSKRKSNEQPEKNFAIGKKAKPTKDKYAVADTADKHKTEVVRFAWLTSTVVLILSFHPSSLVAPPTRCRAGTFLLLVDVDESVADLLACVVTMYQTGYGARDGRR